MKKGKINFKT